MDDLDDVRAYLGYDTINIYGGSYGTRAGLVYLRQHGDRVRTAVLDGVAPTNMRLPLFFPRDVQRAFDRLIADCATDAGCNARYPNLGARARALVERLEKAPPLVSVVHPRTGEHGEIRMTARILVECVRPDVVSAAVGVAAAGPDRARRAERFPGRAGADGRRRRSGGPDDGRRHAAVGDLRRRRAAHLRRRGEARSRWHAVRAARDADAARGLRVLAARQRRRRLSTSRCSRRSRR